jgi:NADH:ubiquinone reductase (non-electrogenic)
VCSILQRGGAFRFWEAECFKIDPTSKKIHCRAGDGTNVDGNGEFVVDYDYLVVTVGAKPNTFNTPGVVENCHFLKVSTCIICI